MPVPKVVAKSRTVSKDFIAISEHQDWLDPQKHLSYLQRRIFNFMELYRSLVRSRGGLIRNAPIPKVFYTRAFIHFKILYEKLVLKGIDHRLYLNAQFVKWSHEDPMYPTTKHFMDPTGDPTFMGLQRWEEYKKALEEKWAFSDIRKEADAFAPMYDSEFEDSQYLVIVYRRYKPLCGFDNALSAIGPLLSPEFVAAHESFVRDNIPFNEHLDRWSKVRQISGTMSTDRYLKGILLDTRRRICGY